MALAAMSTGEATNARRRLNERARAGWQGRSCSALEYLQDEKQTHDAVLHSCTADQRKDFKKYPLDRQARYNKYSLHRYCDKFTERMPIMSSVLREIEDQVELTVARQQFYPGVEDNTLDLDASPGMENLSLMARPDHSTAECTPMSDLFDFDFDQVTRPRAGAADPSHSLELANN